MNSKDKEVIGQLFWDADVNEIDGEKHKRYIIERILQFGRPVHVLWLLAHYSEQNIVETVKHSKNIDRKTACYWAIHYNIPREEILCFNRHLIQPCFY